MIQSNIHNTEFREFAANNKYPMTDDSTYTAESGTRLPLSTFVDIIMYPVMDIPERIRISRVYNAPDTTMEFRGTAVIGSCIVTPSPAGNAIYSEDRRIIGTVVLSDVGAAYLKGLARHAALVFPLNGLVVRPERILIRPELPLSIQVGDQQVTRTDIPLTTVTASERFQPGDGDTITFDGTPREDIQDTIIKELALSGKVNGVTVGSPLVLTLDNRPLIISCDPALNLQVIVNEDGIQFHKRGDA